MRLRFLGAAGEVTGSCYLLETRRARVLIDFGMYQGGVDADERNAAMPPIRAKALDAVVLTHAHIDHSGRLPLLVNEGYDGPIYATPATIDVTEVLLEDSAELQAADAERASRKRIRAGEPALKPPYDSRDVEKLMRLFRALPYETPREIAPRVEALLADAGHILGSASVQLTVREDGETRTIVFSGDIGPKGAALLHDPRTFDRADAVVLESTYGDRDHRPLPETIDELAQILSTAKAEHGKVLIPAFAVGRTQQLVSVIGELLRAGRLRDPEVIIDSPMATTATELYRKHRDLFDEESRRIIEAGDSPLSFPGLRFTKSSAESRSLNERDGGIVIIAGSGMCSGGRILHHLKHNLDKRSTHVVIVGFQSEGSLGRRLVEGAEHVVVMGEPVTVRATIHTLGGFSAHAGQSELVEWMRPMAAGAGGRGGTGGRPRVFLTHGEDPQRAALHQRLSHALGLRAELPGYGEIVEI